MNTLLHLKPRFRRDDSGLFCRDFGKDGARIVMVDLPKLVL